MSSNQIQSPGHNTLRTLLRISGPIVLVAGFVLMAIGAGGAILKDDFAEKKRFFVCFFISMPLLFVGVTACMIGFLGTFSRYVAGEQAPVLKDTANYMAEATKESVKTVAKAAAEGIREGLQPPGDQPPPLQKG